jgi:hypothetical protein
MADADVSAAVGARIGPEVPQAPTFPYVTIGEVATSQDGVVDFNNSVAQVTVWDTDFTRCQEVALTIRYALQRYRGRVLGIRFEGITFVNGMSIKDPETGRWTRPADYRLNYWEEE